MTNKDKAKEIANIYRDRMLQMGQVADNDWLVAELVNDALEWKDKQYSKVIAPILIELDQLKSQVKSLLP